MNKDEANMVVVRSN